MTDGIINVNKPAGWTSQDVCSKLRHVLHTKKIGHTGTLDPMATGVLPVCIGKATRIIEYYDRDIKAYHAAMKLGIVTDTLDITGEVTQTGDFSKVTEKAVREAFSAYTGLIMQVPPKYSALKINGKRAYELARGGKDFDIPAREITIYDNRLTSIDLSRGILEFDVSCSKGTYIRTICDDIGRTLGCGAAMTELVRTASGYFRIGESYTLEEIAYAAESAAASGSGSEHKLQDMIIPADVTLQKLGKIELCDNRVTAFLNGNSSWPKGFRVIQPSDFGSLYRVYARAAAERLQGSLMHSETGGDSKMVFVGIGEIENSSLVPRKVIR